MPDVTLTDTEKQILSYLSRGASKDTAIEKMVKFFSMSTNDVAGAVNSLKRQGLVIESKGVGGGVIVYTTSPLKVKPSMLDQHVIELLKEAEQGGRAAGFKRKAYTADVDTGEIRDADAPRKVMNTPTAKKSGPDLGFDLEE